MSGKEPVIQLELTQMDENAPGFLRRQHSMMQFMHRIELAEESKSYDPAMLSDMVNFLADFVVVPKDKEEAKEILWDLSQKDYLSVMAQLQGTVDLVPPTSESPSESTT